MIRSRLCFCVLCAVSAILAAAILLSSPPEATAGDRPVSFIGDVAPILKENCFACHDAKKRSGKFEITSYQSLMKGGLSGEAIVPGKPSESSLIELIESDGPRRMPPAPKDKIHDSDGALSPAKIVILKQWIAEGAKIDPEIKPDSQLLRELRMRWQPPAPPENYPVPVAVSAMAFTPDGKRIVVGGHHELTVWDIEEQKLRQRIRTRAERFYAMAFVGDLLVTAGGRPGQEGDLSVFDLHGPAKTVEGVAYLDGVNDAKVLVKRLFDIDDSILCLAVRSDGKKLAAGGCDRLIRVWDISDGLANARLEHVIENHADWVLGVSFIGSANQVLSSSRDKTAKVFDLEKKESLQTFPDHQAPVFALVARTDGKAALSVGADKTMRIWNIGEGGKQIKAMGGHSDEVVRIVTVPGQTQVVTASSDKTVRHWKEDGSTIRQLQGPNDQIYALAISADGKLVAAGSWDGEVKIWKLQAGTIVSSFNASPGAPSKPANN